jgi:mannose-6-phosphate isomerase-like protein (cupin superfamily)
MTSTLGRVARTTEVASFEHAPGGRVQFFHGDEHGFGPVTVAISSTPPEAGTPEHRYPCSELFVVVDGQGTYRVGDVEVVAEPGDVVFVPADTWHSFRSTGEVPLRPVGVFPSDHVGTELNRDTASL